MTTGNDPTIDLGVTMPWPDLGVVCCLSGVPGEVRERSFWLKEVSLSLTCSNIIIIIIIGIIIVIIIIINHYY